MEKYPTPMPTDKAVWMKWRHDLEQLENQITELSANINAATFRWLMLIAQYDEVEGWGQAGCYSCAHWLNWRCGIGLNAAREKVRVARALGALPVISASFESGQLSYSQVRAMTRVATPANEEYLLMIARHGTAAHIEKLVRKYRRVKRVEEAALANDQFKGREFGYYFEDDGSVVFKFRLPAEESATVLKALDGVVKMLKMETEGAREAVTGRHQDALTDGNETSKSLVRPPLPVLRADALAVLAESYLQHGGAALAGNVRHQVMLHVDAQTLQADGDFTRCELEHGGDVSAETGRRLCCDASIVPVFQNEQGEVLNIGRKTRTIPTAINRALHARDDGCRFPGCTAKHYVDAHHIKHWADGGETSMENLVTLCRYHHRLVHEGGFGVEANAGGELVFTRPDGEVLAQVPPMPGAEADIVFLNRDKGLNIDHQTCHTRWAGEDIDWWMAVEGLLDSEPRSFR